MATPMPTIPTTSPAQHTRLHWWQSIRWRLALGSMLVAFLATALLALVVILTVSFNYGVDQRTQLASIGADRTARIGILYQENSGNLYQAAKTVLPITFSGNTQGESYLTIVFNRRGQIVYPLVGRPTLAGILLVGTDTSLQRIDLNKVRNAIKNAERGSTTLDEIGASGPSTSSRPFLTQSIHAGGQSSGPVVGVLLMTPYSAVLGTVPPFIAAVFRSVLIASLIVAVLAALAAILFSRTITRPLAKLTQTARRVAAGDYSAQVQTNAQGELGELATAFNDMAQQLAEDVNELRRQELWRRELIMNITHDLATPLTAIAGLGESLMDGVNTSREDYEETGRVIMQETLRLRRLVKDLHLMGKVEANAIQPQRHSVRLATLADEVLAVLTPEFERANVEPRNAISANLPPVEADPDMLSRVFSNLCDNALRHTPPGGVVTLNAMQQQNMLIVAVSDTGKGIPTAALSRIFERFYRGDSSRQEATGGSGLGLAIVRAIVEAHGGTIWAENIQGSGARILFTLPLGHFDNEITLHLG